MQCADLLDHTHHNQTGAEQGAGQGAERGAWQLESVESRLVADNRLTQDYDDIDYTSGNLVSFHTSLAR